MAESHNDERLEKETDKAALDEVSDNKKRDA